MGKLKLFKQSELANVVGTTQSMISYILRHERSPSVAMAEALEDATGVCREAWLFPERHFNPYFKYTADPKTCLRCPNREKIHHKRISILEKRAAAEGLSFDPANDIADYWNDYQGRIVGLHLVMFVHTPEGLKVEMWCNGQRLYGKSVILTEKQAPDLVEQVNSGKPYFTNDYRKSSMSLKDKKVLWEAGVRSFIVVPRQNFTLGELSVDQMVHFSQHSVDIANRIAQILEYYIEHEE